MNDGARRLGRRPALSRVAGLFATALGLSALPACPDTGLAPPPDQRTDAAVVLELARTFIATGPPQVAVEARASQYSDRGGLKGKLELLAERPGRLRMTGLSPTDDMVSVLATDGQRFISFERGAKVCFVGRACPSNVGRFASIPLEADGLVGVLIGRPPIIPHGEARLSWDRAVGGYLLELQGAGADLALARGKIQRLWVGHDDGRILRTAILLDGKVKVDVRYRDFQRRGDHLLPTRLDVLLERESTDLRLDYRDIDVSPGLDAGAFDFACPDGARLEELPCAETP